MHVFCCHFHFKLCLTVARENFERFKFRIFCNSRKFIREILNANRNYRYTAIVSSNMVLLKYFAKSKSLPDPNVPCQARRSIVPTERRLPCSLLPVPLAWRMTDPGNVHAVHIWSLPLSRRLTSLDMRMSQGIRSATVGRSRMCAIGYCSALHEITSDSVFCKVDNL